MSAAPPFQLPVLFSGKFKHAVDPSHRIMLPSRWRCEDAPRRFIALLWPVPVGTHILVVTPERFAGALATFRETALQDNTVAALERQLSEFLVDTTTDKVGRLPLTEEILEAAKIEKEALLMGRLEKFEIWNPDRFAATRETDAQLAADGFQNTTLRL